MKAGDTSFILPIETVEDRQVEGDETIIISVTHSSQVADLLGITLTIEDDDEPTWNVSAVPSMIEEGGAATLTVETGGVFYAAEQTIGLMLGGEATVGTDYTISDSEAMALTAPDSLTLPAEAMTVTVEPDSPYQVSPTNGSATIRIVDDDADTVPGFPSPVRILTTGPVSRRAGRSR